MAKYSRCSWAEIQGMKQKADRLMDELGDNPNLVMRQEGRNALWQPLGDAWETVSEYVVQLELPGIDKERVEIEVVGQEIWVYGERRMEKDVRGAKYHLLERSYGPFARKFEFPQEVDQSTISARLDNGLLTITIPKRHVGAETKRITISVA